jgi:hypothetical protein
MLAPLLSRASASSWVIGSPLPGSGPCAPLQHTDGGRANLGLEKHMTMTRTQIAITGAIILAAAAILYGMGHPLICKCGYVKLWHFDVMSAENSQHIIDWYTTSHIIHGFVFYALLWLFARRMPFGTRLILAVVVEASWEVIENTDFIINHYREMTVSLDYYGDSVLNSVSDILFMVFGFYLAAWLPVWLTILTAVALEVFIGVMIRDNLTLNVIMFVWPMDWILRWQQGRGG